MKPWELWNQNKNLPFWKTGFDFDYWVGYDENENKVRLVIQETSSFWDWLVNLAFPAKLYREQEYDMLVCWGWGSVWKQVNDEVFERVDTFLKAYPKASFEICGYSYGGAMALLAAEDYWYRTKNQVDSVITFGAPKVLYGKKTKAHVASCIKEIVQYAHPSDMVTFLPPLPGYCRIRTDLINKEKFSLKKFFNPNTYHCLYGTESEYDL